MIITEFQLAKINSARHETGSDSVFDIEKREDESMLVQMKVKKLLDEIVVTQQKKIEEASKALNLCHSTVEFNGSSEHVGGEWALLVASKFLFLYDMSFIYKLDNNIEY